MKKGTHKNGNKQAEGASKVSKNKLPRPRKDLRPIKKKILQQHSKYKTISSIKKDNTQFGDE